MDEAGRGVLCAHLAPICYAIFMHKALLLDADGVTILAPHPYSFTYAEQQGLDPAKIEPFFAGQFQQALRGKADLKELIASNYDIWHCDNPDQLLQDWFAAENVPSVSISKIITEARAQGIPTFLATNQEQYRTAYLRTVMFPDVFDDLLVSCELEHTKREPGYWQLAIEKIAQKVPHIQPAEILYFDDSPADIAVAKAAGVDARLFTGPHQVREALGLV